MLFIAKLIGIIILGSGIAFFLDPSVFKKFIAFFLKQKKNIHAGGICRIILGIIFILASWDPACRMEGLILLFGVLFLLGGILVFVLGPKKIEKMIKWVSERPPATQRIFAVIYVAIGVLIVYSA